mmetsp:Transcript_2917/g.7592  ORF Transcript_2917/g.7592 Transcript_2917/m.7592 type:complete len:81 (-) Transcript_2917:774-1016(-)
MPAAIAATMMLCPAHWLRVQVVPLSAVHLGERQRQELPQEGQMKKGVSNLTSAGSTLSLAVYKWQRREQGQEGWKWMHKC